MDAFKNFAVSFVAVAPSPPVSGPTLSVIAGHGARFPTPPFNLVIWPKGVLPEAPNAEIVRVTAIAGDVLTILRQQEGTYARVIQVGDRIAETFTEKTLADLASAALAPPLSAATRLVGRGSAAGAGPAQELTIGGGLTMIGTQLQAPRSSVLINYTYNNSTAEPPVAGQVRINALHPFTAATKLWMRFVSADGQDVYWGVMIIEAGMTLLFQDKDDHTLYGRFTVTGPPVDKGLYAEIPVVWASNGGAIATAQQVLMQRSGGATPPAVLAQIAALEARVAALESRG
jgi:hypothetical protein